MQIESLESVISAFILLTAFTFLMQNRIHNLINTFIWQSVLLTLATLLQAINLQNTELYISTALIFSLKVITIPYLLKRFATKLDIRRKVAVINHPFLLLLGAAFLVLFCYHLLGHNVLAVAMAVTLLGMLLLITHHKAMAHVIGFMSMENGIFFAALVATHGMPMTVELGISFDVLIAVILFGIFFLQLRRSIDSLDVDRLNLLRENKE